MKFAKNKTTISQVAQVLSQHNNIALFAHTRPDGDTVGATVALRLALQKLGKNVQIFCDGEFSDKLLKFPHTAEIATEFFGKWDLMVAVDCGDLQRLGNFAGFYNQHSNTMTVDHHGGEYYSKHNCVLNYASTCQMVWEVLEALGVELDSTIATYLYMGLCTDTGNFANSNTNEQSFLMAAKMCQLGADIQKVNRVFFKETTYMHTKLYGKIMSRVRRFYDGKLCIVYITQQDLQEFGLDHTASEGIVRFAFDIDTAIVGVSLCEWKPNSFKCSMRGKDFNVRQICQEFGGGGHEVASGCLINGFLEDVIEKIERVVGYTLC